MTSVSIPSEYRSELSNLLEDNGFEEDAISTPVPERKGSVKKDDVKPITEDPKESEVNNLPDEEDEDFDNFPPLTKKKTEFQMIQEKNKGHKIEG